jgi:hypothetical protein
MNVNHSNNIKQKIPGVGKDCDNNPTSLKCPNCGLINPGSAKRCDCGYDFITFKQEKSYLSDITKPNVHRKQSDSNESGINNKEKKQSEQYSLYRKRIIMAANFGIAIGCLKIVGAIYLLFLITSTSDESLISLLPSVNNIQGIYTIFLGIIFVHFGIKIKKSTINSKNSILILLVLSIISLVFSAIDLRHIKIGIDLYIAGLFVIALRSQKLLADERK